MSFPIIHVFTDVGVKDIDDELLIMYLCSQKNLDLTFVFMGSDGVSPSEALVHWIREYEPTVLKNTPDSLNNKISYMTISEYKDFDAVVCDYALQIAPMSGYTGENLTVRKKYIFAGDYDTPVGARDSFNKQGAQDILDRFQSQDKLIDIPSEHMAKMRFNKSLFSKFSEPCFRDNIVFTAFMLAYGRMDPKHPANKFAEGLINPNAGRGANYNSVMKMGLILLSGLPADSIYLMKNNWPGNIKSCEASAKNYCALLEVHGVTLKDREGTIKCLSDMNIYLQSISHLQNIVESETEILDIFESGSVFTSNFDINSIPKEILSAWEYFKIYADSLIESFNPVYDLFAGYVLMGIIKNEYRVNHTPEDFLKNIVCEF